MFRFAILAALLACAPSLSPFGGLRAQSSGSMFNQRDDQYRVLGLKRAKEAYETAAKEYDRQKMLFEKGLISQAELDRNRANFADAEVNYQQSRLAVLFEQQYVTVVKAVKYQSPDGTKRVRLQLANASGGSAEFRKLINLDDALFRSLQPDIVTVNIIYGKGTQRALKVFLEKDATVNKVLVQSTQFSQEAELGKAASFDLTLELFGGLGSTFNLEVANLPGQVNRTFRDPAGGARLNQFKFTETTNSRKAALDISLPDRPTDAIPMDRPIKFFVLVIPSERMGEFKDLQRRQWSEEEIGKLRIGYVKLELVPRGTGRLLVRAQQLYFSINSAGAVDMTIELVNEGSRRLDDVEINADLPLNWSKAIEPAVINALDIGEEKKVHLHFTK